MKLNIEELCCSCDMNEKYLLDIQEEFNQLKVSITALKEKIKKYEEVLKIYADPYNWTHDRKQWANGKHGNMLAYNLLIEILEECPIGKDTTGDCNSVPQQKEFDKLKAEIKELNQKLARWDLYTREDDR